MENEEEQDFGVIEGTDENGDTFLLQVLDYFFYNGEEYAILTDAEDEEDCGCGCDACDEHCDHHHDTDEDDEEEEVTCYIMKVNNSTGEDGEDVEEFVPVEDEELEAKLIEVAMTQLDEAADAEDKKD